MLLLSILVFFATSLGAAGLYLWLAPSKTARRLHAINPQPAGQSSWTESAAGLVGPFARFSAPAGNWWESPVRLRFLHAGIHHEEARLVFYGLKTLLPFVVALVMLIGARLLAVESGLTFLLALAVAALIACYLPDLVLAWRGRRRKREIFEEFPDAADLLLICVESGMGLDAGIERVTQEMRVKSMALANELHWTALEMQAGVAREQALRHLALRSGLDEVGTFATMLIQAGRQGTPIGDALRVFSDDLRFKRQSRAEEQAAKVPVKMLFPLVACIFPAILAVIIGPAAIQVIRTILPLLQGAG